MVTKKQLLAVLPPFNNKIQIASWGQSVKSIIREVLKGHEMYETDYDAIYPYFDTGEIYSTCRGLWDFCKYNLKYTIETDQEQSIKSPTAILQPGAKVDCKHYSLFIGGVLDAIKTNESENWDWCYRFVSDEPDKIIGHVFIVVFTSNGEINIDPVLSTFDAKRKWTNVKDEFIEMPVFSISGLKKKVGAYGITPEVMQPTVIDVDKLSAEQNFLILVNANLFALKTLLKSDSDILYNKVRPWYTAQGYDFEHLLRIINQ
jgi:hypothetical protein